MNEEERRSNNEVRLVKKQIRTGSIGKEALKSSNNLMAIKREEARTKTIA